MRGGNYGVSCLGALALVLVREKGQKLLVECVCLRKGKVGVQEGEG